MTTPRRGALAAAASCLAVGLAGCLAGSPTRPESLERRELPGRPADPTAAALTRYATRYLEAREYNRHLDSLADEPDYHEELSVACDGVYESETPAGHAVTASCAWSSVITDVRSGGSHASEGATDPLSLLVTGEAVLEAPLELEARSFFESARPPYSTRGFVVANFASSERRVAVTVERESDDADAASEDPVFEAAYDLEGETGELEPGVLEGAGDYAVTVSAETDHEHRWTVDDEPRGVPGDGNVPAFDVALGIYVLPDGSVAIRDVPESRPTA